MLWLVLWLQVFAPADGPSAQWEMTVQSSERPLAVRRVCQPAPTDADYLRGVEGMQVQGACAPATTRRSDDGWVREQRCVSREGQTFVLHAARRGDLLRDVVFSTALQSPAGAEHWTIRTRLRRLGPCAATAAPAAAAPAAATPAAARPAPVAPAAATPAAARAPAATPLRPTRVAPRSRGEPDEPVRGPTRCPGKVLRGSC